MDWKTVPFLYSQVRTDKTRPLGFPLLEELVFQDGKGAGRANQRSIHFIYNVIYRTCDEFSTKDGVLDGKINSRFDE